MYFVLNWKDVMHHVLAVGQYGEAVALSQRSVSIAATIIMVLLSVQWGDLDEQTTNENLLERPPHMHNESDE